MGVSVNYAVLILYTILIIEFLSVQGKQKTSDQARSEAFLFILNLSGFRHLAKLPCGLTLSDYVLEVYLNTFIVSLSFKVNSAILNYSIGIHLSILSGFYSSV